MKKILLLCMLFFISTAQAATIRDLSSGAGISGTDLLYCRQGSDTQDRACTFSQVFSYVIGTIDADDISDTSTTNKFVTSSDITNLSNLSGTNTGDQTITLQGDITGTGTGTFTTSIATGAIVLSDIAGAALSGSDSTLLTGTAGTSGHCAQWNGDGDLVTSGAACGGGGAGGDSVSVNGSGVTDPDFTSTGSEITLTDTSNVITFTIKDDIVAPANMADGDHGDFTYSSNSATLDADSVADNEIDYTAVTLADFTNDASFITATLTQEQVEDYAGGMLTGNTETLITVTYQDGDGTVDFVVDNDLSNYSNATSGFITDYTVTEGDVTAHEAALTVTESQISDLGAYLTSIDSSSDIDAGVIDETDLDTSTNASLDLADSAVQPGDTIPWQISGHIETPAEKDYYLILDTAYAVTVTEVTTDADSGTCTGTVKINTTALGGTANSISSTETSQSHASANTMSAGDDLVLTISSNSSCDDVRFKVSGTRAIQ